jgi:hypothetical protein
MTATASDNYHGAIYRAELALTTPAPVASTHG